MRNPVNIVFENPINGDYFEHCNNVSETCVDINGCYPKRDKDNKAQIFKGGLSFTKYPFTKM